MLIGGLVVINQIKHKPYNLQIVQVLSAGNIQTNAQYIIENGRMTLIKEYQPTSMKETTDGFNPTIFTSQQEKEIRQNLKKLFGIDNPKRSDLTLPHFRTGIPVEVVRKDDGIQLKFLNLIYSFYYTTEHKTRLVDDNGIEYQVIMEE